jgi:hypothetical protein
MQLALAQDAEHYARDRRLAVEAEIVAIMPGKHEGTVTDKDAGLSVTYKITRKLDYAAYQAIADGLPEGLQCVDMKPTLNLKSFRALELVEPSLAASFVTESPAKPSISILETK